MNFSGSLNSAAWSRNALSSALGIDRLLVLLTLSWLCAAVVLSRGRKGESEREGERPGRKGYKFQHHALPNEKAPRR